MFDMVLTVYVILRKYIETFVLFLFWNGRSVLFSMEKIFAIANCN